ncbi:hypothetical protein Tasa_019_086 [Tanticharoenia sakaeratensis NBRC 103193]|uniref:Uncharacterized protein n=1 Tax=Tanticharoenia sakaeratensis NBRC 103193 TaxID=1231623 RepID=A0A0D6MLT1_9PROT|nr:hypothetical protein Tasa_019_086 [Tanticharoenia sakaeratensis NBRC 103193]GBQ18714.1 hypothetical protein AA103193_0785 [Tanticharoenia sakaeratensis NBRC 103193]
MRGTEAIGSSELSGNGPGLKRRDIGGWREACFALVRAYAIFRATDTMFHTKEGLRA